MSKARFTVVYKGPALADGRMDVKDLAPALLAIGQLFDAANQTLNRDGARVNLSVVATNTGSFEILLEIQQFLSTQLVGFLNGEGVTAALNLAALVAGVDLAKGGLFALVKRLQGRSPDKVQQLDGGIVRITIDGTTFDVPIDLLRLYQDIAVRRSLRSILAPLNSEGIEKFEVRNSERISVVEIEKADLPSFQEPQIPDETILEDTRRAAFSILSLAFKEDNKWRLSDGNATIAAKIEDEDFLDRVDKNLISFAKGDILVCEVSIRQSRSRDGLKTEYTVHKVIEHKPAARQLRFEGF